MTAQSRQEEAGNARRRVDQLREDADAARRRVLELQEKTAQHFGARRVPQ